ncbi:MAG: hypothetical protein JST28_00850 [Acidobacteria bacterium]|nr:hypothetical protein [Acidobacteriota bacterium]
MFALSSYKRIFIAAVGAVALSVFPAALNAQDADDPPPEAGRVSYISGNVSIQPASSDQWGQAYPNLPVGPGDRIYTDNGGRAEIQIGRTYVRIGSNSDVTLVDDSQFNINFGVAQGSIRLHSFGLWPRQLVDISTPNGNAEFGEQGDLRVDVLPQDGATVFTNLGQFADITGAGNYRQQLDYGQSLEVAGTNPVYPQWLQPAGPDDLDAWSQERDRRMASVASYNYVSPDVPGAADLDASGDWQAETEYGPMWFPREVSSDWAPYRNGHWINRDPWGWVWVEDEPWGYAPFHYGRWVQYRNRWGWVPGPVNVRPVWSPALVVFAGGGGGGLSLSAWFPLGPGEAYRPWYRCSPRYIDQVNITNIRPAPRVRVERTYVNVVNVTNVTNITYINREHVTAVRRDDFGSGRRVRDVAVRVDPREMQRIRPMAQPPVAAPSRPIITRPVAHVPAKVERPMLINQRGQEIAAKPRAVPVAPPVRQAPAPRPLPGRTVVAAPAHQVPNGRGPQNQDQSPAAQGNPNQRPDTRPNQPNQPNQANQPPAGVPRANPAGQVPGYQRGIDQRPGTPVNGNPQQRTVNPNDRQQPTQPAGRPLPPTNQQQENRPNQPQPNQPQVNQPDRGRPDNGRPDNGRPDNGRPNDQRQGRPDNLPQDRPNQPAPPNYQQPQRPTPPPNNQQQERPIPPTYQQPNPQQNRPNFPQPDRRNQQPDQQPRPNQPQNPPPSDRNRPDFSPGQQRRDNPAPQQRPTPPQQQDRQYTPPPQQQRPNPQQERPTPPPQQDRQYTPPPQQRPQPQHEERQAPPPRSIEQPRQQQPPPQARPQQNDRPRDNQQKRDNNKKEDKKPHD